MGWRQQWKGTKLTKLISKKQAAAYVKALMGLMGLSQGQVLARCQSDTCPSQALE